MSGPDDDLLRPRVRVMQVIAAALPLGVLAFLTFVLVQGKGSGMAPPGAFPWLSIVAVVMLLVNLPFILFLTGSRTRTALREIASGTWQPPRGAKATDFTTDASKLLSVRQTTMLIPLAALEGAAFCGCLAFMLEARPFALGVIVVAIILMLLNFPTEGRVRAWLDVQADRLAELRYQKLS